MAVGACAPPPDVIWNVLSTGDAAEFWESPGCVALTRHVPGPITTIVNPEIVHTDGVNDTRVTVRADEAVAPDEIEILVPLHDWVLGAAKLIV